MYTFSLFASLDANSFAKAPCQSWEEWVEILSTPCPKSKNMGLPLIGFYSLKNERAPRCDDNVSIIHAIALDYEETHGPVPHIGDLDLPFQHLIYTTPSHTPMLPRYRIVIPFSCPISAEELPKAFSELIEEGYISTSGLDPSCADISRSFYIYSSLPEGHFVKRKFGTPDIFFDPHLNDQETFDKWQAQKRTITVNGIGGRNDTLKLQACAGIGIGKSVDEVAEELVVYDFIHHLPPLFNDPSEPNYRDGDTPTKRAKAFINRVTRKIPRPESTIKDSGPIDAEIEMSNGPANTGTDNEKNQQVNSSPTSGTMPDSIFSMAPPLVTNLAEFIYNSSYSQNIPYCVASAVSLLSMYKRTRFKCGTLYPNLYIALVGETSSGKSSTTSTTQFILQKLGLSDFCIGSPFSGSGLGKALEKHQGEGYWFWEEFGNHLEASVGRNAQSHEKGMLGELNKLYDKAGTEYRMNQYANEKTKNIVLQKTFLSILATGTTGEVQKLISGSSVSSGFFPRWLLVSPESASTHQLDSCRPQHLPASLLADIERVEWLFPNWMDFNANINIGYEPDAAEIALNYKLPLQERPELWGKFMENSKRVALAVCEGKNLTLGELEFGMEFTRHCLEFAEKLFVHQTALADVTPLLRFETQSMFNTILKLFKGSPTVWIPFVEIPRLLGCSEKTARKYLQMLVSSEKIIEQTEATGSVGQPRKIYKLV